MSHNNIQKLKFSPLPYVPCRRQAVPRKPDKGSGKGAGSAKFVSRCRSTVAEQFWLWLRKFLLTLISFCEIPHFRLQLGKR